jgi:phosphoglycolate phosphatase
VSIHLACLDMAGTTVSDGGAVEVAFSLAMTSEGIHPGDDRYERALTHVRATMGQSKIVVFTALFDGDSEAAARANQAFEDAYRSTVEAGQITPIPGAEEVIRSLRRGGCKVCLTTGFAPVTRDAILAALGWETLADLALSPADAGRGRPYPDMILTAILRLEVESVADVAVAGDTASDMLAGRRAGASIVAAVLTGAHDRATLEAAPHTHIIDSITDLPPLLADSPSLDR